MRLLNRIVIDVFIGAALAAALLPALLLKGLIDSQFAGLLVVVGCIGVVAAFHRLVSPPARP
jgi:hypothetical protein